MRRRVVITGMGVVSPVGIGIDRFWNSVKEGRSGIGYLTSFDTSNMPTKIAAEVREFEADEFIDKKSVKRMDKFTQYAMAAAKLAMDSSGLYGKKINNYRMGVVVGSGNGGIGTVIKQYDIFSDRGPDKVSPFSVPMIIPNIAAAQIAMKYEAKGFSECVVSSCATSTNAIGDAFRLIRHGYADIMITGGAEAALTPLSFAGFCSMRSMSRKADPKEACKPFDADRDGFVMGEGAGILILEDYEHAVRRGAYILAEIIGYGCTNDAYDIVAPEPNADAVSECIRIAINDAGIRPEEIEYINAHGSSTQYNDKCETKAIKDVFGSHSRNLKVSSTKSMTGHLLGAAGAIEAIITALALKNGFLPPTINYNTPDPECDLDYIPNTGLEKIINYAISNSFGFGGHNAVLVLKKFIS
ncbi:MAG: beta-ketoacyl-ACP synthase II [Bacillota bacterium]